jgi:hypothetical protein
MNAVFRIRPSRRGSSPGSELGGYETLALVVEEQRIGSVPESVAHSGGYVDVGIAILR